MGAALGSVALSIGMVLIVIASSADSSALFLVGGLIGGAGFGVAFLGALRALSAAIPADERAAVMSAFYVVAYLSISVPAIVGRRRGHLARPAHDVRGLRARGRRARAGRRRRGVAVAARSRPARLAAVRAS